MASYQGYPNWIQVKNAGYRFAFTKATESVYYLNPYFRTNWSEIKHHGLVRGVYHFAQPNDNSPAAEVNWFLTNVRLEPGDIPVLDMEHGDGDLKGWTIEWLWACHQMTGTKPLLYTGQWFMDGHNLCNTEVCQASGGLWLASYQSQVPPVPVGWNEITFWQYTDKAHIPGIEGGADCNIYRP